MAAARCQRLAKICVSVSWHVWRGRPPPAGNAPMPDHAHAAVARLVGTASRGQHGALSHGGFSEK